MRAMSGIEARLLEIMARALEVPPVSQAFHTSPEMVSSCGETLFRHKLKVVSEKGWIQKP